MWQDYGVAEENTTPEALTTARLRRRRDAVMMQAH